MAEQPQAAPTTQAKVSAVETNIGRTLTEVERRIVGTHGHGGPPKQPERRVGTLDGVCARHDGATLENFVCASVSQSEAVERLRNVFTARHVQHGDGLFFSGAPGTGKDHLAVAMLKRAKHIGFHCRWLDCPSFYADVADCYRQGSARSAVALVRELSTWDVLCLSDPVVRGMTESQVSTLGRIVNNRWLAAKSTWVTCNALDLKWADQKFGDRTMSRLLDGAVRIYCDWEDYRKHPAPALSQKGT